MTAATNTYRPTGDVEVTGGEGEGTSKHSTYPNGCDVTCFGKGGGACQRERPALSRRGSRASRTEGSSTTLHPVEGSRSGAAHEILQRLSPR